MSAPLRGVLPIDKGVIFFTILCFAVGERYFNIISFYFGNLSRNWSSTDIQS